MINIEKIFLFFLLGAILPILLFLAGWWTTYQNPSTFYIALAGLLAGILIDAVFLRRWIRRAWEIPAWLLICIYLFYTTGIYGFFMGFPVFNILAGIAAGYYYGKRLSYNNTSLDESRKQIQRVALFTAAVMTLICTASALLALNEETIGLQLQHMLGLPFEITRGMVWAIILAGGLLLICSQYFVTRISLNRTFSKNRKSAAPGVYSTTL